MITEVNLTTIQLFHYLFKYHVAKCLNLKSDLFNPSQNQTKQYPLPPSAAPCYNQIRKGASGSTDTPLTRPFKTVDIKLNNQKTVIFVKRLATVFLIVYYYQHNGDDQRNQR